MSEFFIRLISSDDEARAGAEIMASTDPWLRLGRTFEHTYRTVSNPTFERCVAIVGGKVARIVLLAINLPLINGYVAALAVGAEFRNAGVGSKLLRFAEERIFEKSPNVFLCVTSFNIDAQRFYARHGYAQVGLLKDYDVPGVDEFLMRKTRGAWAGFGAK